MEFKHIIKKRGEEVREFFLHPALWEESKIDGKTQDDLLESMCDKSDFFIETYYDDLLVSTTCCEKAGEHAANVHTFVLPEYRKHSVEILKSHIEVLNRIDFVDLYTTCSSENRKVFNFLNKRLGFVMYDVFTSEKLKRNGELLTIYKLVRGGGY